MATRDAPPLIGALDIGSSKVSALVCTVDEDGRPRVLGTGQRESRGVKRGFITDMEASEHAVREAVELAERMSAVTVDEVWASFGANGLVSDVANVEVELGGHQVEQSDIEELLSAGKSAIDRGGQMVLHAHPALFTIDRAQGVQQPIGLYANRLGESYRADRTRRHYWVAGFSAAALAAVCLLVFFVNYRQRETRFRHSVEALAQFLEAENED